MFCCSFLCPNQVSEDVCLALACIISLRLAGFSHRFSTHSALFFSLFFFLFALWLPYLDSSLDVACQPADPVLSFMSAVTECPKCLTDDIWGLKKRSCVQLTWPVMSLTGLPRAALLHLQGSFPKLTSQEPVCCLQPKNRQRLLQSKSIHDITRATRAVYVPSLGRRRGCLVSPCRSWWFSLQAYRVINFLNHAELVKRLLGPTAGRDAEHLVQAS